MLLVFIRRLLFASTRAPLCLAARSLGLTVLLAGLVEAEHLVILTWTPSISPDVAGYRVYRRLLSSGQFVLLNAATVPGSSYIDQAVQASQSYAYVVTAVDIDNNESIHSNEGQAVIPPPAYAGFVETVSCSAGITGWAADRDRLGESISVSLRNGSTQITSVLANALRVDIGASLGDTGFHGFRIPIPAAYADGVSRRLQVFFEDSDTPLGSSLVTVQCGGGGGGGGGTAVPVYAGWTDSISCSSGISGWAADRNRLNQAINVTLWDGATQISTVLANIARSDVGAVLGDNGLHGYRIPIPPAYATGITRTFQVRYETSTTQLPLSPITLTCGGGSTSTPVYSGYVDSASCNGITGWAADRNRLNQSINVSLWDGNTQITSMLANAARGDVGAVLGDNGLHGYSIPIPSGYANGVPHTLQVRYETSGTQLSSSPVTINCGNPSSTAAVYAGWVDSASCSGITGWAADRNRLNQAINVTLWDGNTQISSMVANAFRGDVGAFLHDNGLHGYTFPIPVSYANGVSHALQVRYEGSSTQLPLSPVTINCGASSSSNANYTGWVDVASCSAISGWAADRSRLNQPISVDLVEGSNILVTVLANGSRGDVGAVLGDNGLHGYALTPPLALRDGVAHNILVRYSGTSTAVPNSPRTLQCSTTIAPQAAEAGTTHAAGFQMMR